VNHRKKMKAEPSRLVYRKPTSFNCCHDGRQICWWRNI